MAVEEKVAYCTRNVLHSNHIFVGGKKIRTTFFFSLRQKSRLQIQRGRTATGFIPAACTVCLCALLPAELEVCQCCFSRLPTSAHAHTQRESTKKIEFHGVSEKMCTWQGSFLYALRTLPSSFSSGNTCKLT